MEAKEIKAISRPDANKNEKRNKDTGLKELSGSSEERIRQINEIGRTHRPIGKIVGIPESPNRDKEQMCTLTEVSAGNQSKQ